ncbi:hypothetical protein B5F82_02050 [Megamonas hypermegale]|uniref:hypothetical protein n=1 Tax=Megamonas hypermegale TaxID=158847 RepID=UPI000B36C06B|nr:hypothetical protein [Megamonas hypermegale]OUO41171.1 hypothetical protein B5F82_02050 [Megamonas hypermegale]
MINVETPKFKTFLNKIHDEIESKKRRTNGNDYILENRILKLVLEKKSLGPGAWARLINEKYNYSISTDEVITVLRSTYPKLNYPDDRERTLLLVEEVANSFIKALSLGTPEAFETFKRKRNSIFSTKRSFPRLICLEIFNKCPEINTLGDGDTLENFRDVIDKYILYGLTDALAEYCNTTNLNNKKRAFKQKRDKKNINIDDLEQRIAYLEGALQRSNMMMQDLQDEFDEQLLETKIQEMTAFFAKLNADKYGRILDTLLQVRKGIIQLKKQHIVLPPEISGLFILIQKLSQFVIDNHIDPIMKPNSKQRIKANEAELCDYEGTPFKDNNEEKIIMVFSPGWIYKDKDIRIARPKIKEVVENE